MKFVPVIHNIICTIINRLPNATLFWLNTQRLFISELYFISNLRLSILTNRNSLFTADQSHLNHTLNSNLKRANQAFNLVLFWCYGADVVTKFVPNRTIRRWTSGTNLFDYYALALFQIAPKKLHLLHFYIPLQHKIGAI